MHIRKDGHLNRQIQHTQKNIMWIYVWCVCVCVDFLSKSAKSFLLENVIFFYKLDPCPKIQVCIGWDRKLTKHYKCHCSFLRQVTKNKDLIYHITAKTWSHLLFSSVKKSTWRIKKKIWIKQNFLKKIIKASHRNITLLDTCFIIFSRIEQGTNRKHVAHQIKVI